MDPVWDADFVFPLEVQTIQDILNGKVNVLVRDFDDADGDVHYLDLGRVSVPLEEVITRGKIMAQAQLVQLAARWYPLERCRSMRKVAGALKIAVGVFVGHDSTLLPDEDSEAESIADRAVLFERKLCKLRAARGMSGRRTVSASPTRGGYGKARVLTARGGTVGQRPKSAPTAATLASPAGERRNPFRLKPLEPKLAVPKTELGEDSDLPGRRVTASSGIPGDLSPKGHPLEREIDERPRGRKHARGSTEICSSPCPPSRGGLRDAMGAVSPSREESSEDRDSCFGSLATPCAAAQEQAPVRVKTSTKLSRLTAKAQGRQEGMRSLAVRDDARGEGAAERARRWHRALLVSVQRLEDRSTESMAYGELRSMTRNASPSQAAQIIAAVRGTGSDFSLSARRYALRILAWLCWDQPRAARKACSGIIAYVLARIRDDETASLRRDLMTCVGAVMLSALRKADANECMVQIQRLLDLLTEYRSAVRDSAGACCVAAVHPPPTPVAVDVVTDLHSINEVRLVLGQIAERLGVTITVPKESLLLPDGTAVVELPDALSAASFYRRLKLCGEGVPSTWQIQPFPEVSGSRRAPELFVMRQSCLTGILIRLVDSKVLYVIISRIIIGPTGQVMQRSQRVVCYREQRLRLMVYDGDSALVTAVSIQRSSSPLCQNSPSL